MFTPIRTARLLIRPFTAADTDGLVARRNDPEVAKYQDWTLPYTRERAEKTVSDLVAMDGPENDQWWMAVVCDADTGEVFGDLALVEYLFEQPNVTRVFRSLHPDNPASAMVLERVGMLFEGHTKSSFWIGGENSDDWIYGLTRPDWTRWRQRPHHPPAKVELVEIDVTNQPLVSKLATHKTQEEFVAPMSDSFTDALFPEVVDGAPVALWFRAVVADEEIVGFMVLALRTEHHPEPYLWRLLIDRLHNGEGSVAGCSNWSRTNVGGWVTRR